MGRYFLDTQYVYRITQNIFFNVPDPISGGFSLCSDAFQFVHQLITLSIKNYDNIFLSIVFVALMITLISLKSNLVTENVVINSKEKETMGLNFLWHYQI